MSKNNSTVGKESADAGIDGEETWPRKLNRVLIGVGVVAFGLIIADRLINMLKVDDIPDTAQIERTVETQSVAAVNGEVAADAVPTAQASEANLLAQPEDMPADTEVADTAAISDDSPLADSVQEVLDIEDVFGGRLVFVSASEPRYVVTENDRRIDVGSSVDEHTTLSGLTSERVILEKDGDLLVISLPDPSAQ